MLPPKHNNEEDIIIKRMRWLKGKSSLIKLGEGGILGAGGGIFENSKEK